MLSNLPKPAVIAHRGSSVHAPENTLDAFYLAVQQGADAVELDVRITADHQVVVFHDRSIDRITSISGQVHKLTYQELALLDASSAFGKMYPKTRIPLLEDVLSAIGEQIPINIELKTIWPFSSLLSSLTVDCLSKFLPNAQVILSSFNPFILFKVHRLIPDLDLGLIVSRNPFPFWKLSHRLGLLPIQSLHAPHQELSPSHIAAAQDQGLKVFAYTVNRPQIIDKLIRSNIDGVFTDAPLLARRIIDLIPRHEVK